MQPRRLSFSLGPTRRPRGSCYAWNSPLIYMDIISQTNIGRSHPQASRRRGLEGLSNPACIGPIAPPSSIPGLSGISPDSLTPKTGALRASVSLAFTEIGAKIGI